ncbi:MAG TPA: L,D-transpeptidase [Candidatus Binatia bacterium]|jgi:lipoprotein-anchoring transpeptidase ErfK/SrfK|nr:L,D-transpeptidase [Candidatus Binatia bacterium]
MRWSIVAMLVAPALAVAQAAAPVPYRLMTPKAALAGRSTAQLAVLEKLNRVDRAHLAGLGVVVVPVMWDDGPTAHSPLPLVWSAAFPYPKAIAVDVAGQVFGAYEYGVLVRWAPVSSGRRDDRTPPGFYHLNWHSTGRHSTVDPKWFMPWYFNFGSREGIAFHQFDLPGRPASHACVRLREDDARWLWDWGEGWTLAEDGRSVLTRGTPVAIVGTYTFDRPPPWRSLAWLAQPVALPLVFPDQSPARKG